jgi:hypothetical protein
LSKPVEESKAALITPRPPHLINQSGRHRLTSQSAKPGFLKQPVTKQETWFSCFVCENGKTGRNALPPRDTMPVFRLAAKLLRKKGIVFAGNRINAQPGPPPGAMSRDTNHAKRAEPDELTR